jgi:hypothetical protein
MNPEIIEKIEKHYIHAQRKHPYFCDKLTYLNDFCADSALSTVRTMLNNAIKIGHVSFMDVLTCELFEAEKEMAVGNKKRAIEELLDMIAVCLRGIDVLEGRQALGDPEKKGGAK